MASSNDSTKAVPVEVTTRLSQRAETHTKAGATAVALGQGPFSLAAVGDAAAPRFNGAAVAVYQPPSLPSPAPPELWVIWGPVQGGGRASLISAVGHADGDSLRWDTAVPVKDTQGNSIQSAYTPTLAVLAGQLHLIIVKPDGRGTLAQYVYIDSLGAWEYNSGWDVQPQTTASPSVTAFNGLLYLAFITDEDVSVCTYTPSTTEGVKYGTWSAPATTAVSSEQAPALFTSPRRTGAELHLAVAHTDTLIQEYAMGNGIADWTPSALQPGGTTNGGVGACNTTSEAFLTSATADVKNPVLQYTVWTEDGNTWPPLWSTVSGQDGPLPATYSDVTCAVFDRKLCCFYIGPQGSTYTLWVVPIPLFGN